MERGAPPAATHCETPPPASRRARRCRATAACWAAASPPAWPTCALPRPGARCVAASHPAVAREGGVGWALRAAGQCVLCQGWGRPRRAWGWLQGCRRRCYMPHLPPPPPSFFLPGRPQAALQAVCGGTGAAGQGEGGGWCAPHILLPSGALLLSSHDVGVGRGCPAHTAQRSTAADPPAPAPARRSGRGARRAGLRPGPRPQRRLRHARGCASARRPQPVHG